MYLGINITVLKSFELKYLSLFMCAHTKCAITIVYKAMKREK